VVTEGNQTFFRAYGLEATAVWTSEEINATCFQDLNVTVEWLRPRAGSRFVASDYLLWTVLLDGVSVFNSPLATNSGQPPTAAGLGPASIAVGLAPNASLRISASIRLTANSGDYAFDNVAVRGAIRAGVQAPQWGPWNDSPWGGWDPWLPRECYVPQARQRTRSRVRSCLASGCALHVPCEGNSSDFTLETETRGAAENCECGPLDALWSGLAVQNISEWSAWDPIACGVKQFRSQTVFWGRTCSEPQCGGKSCAQVAVPVPFTLETLTTDTKNEADNCCPVHGAWAPWGSFFEWQPWSSFQPPACGVNQTRNRTRERHRQCGGATCGGDRCPGEAVATEVQQEARSPRANCCPQNGTWSAWGLATWSIWSPFFPPQCNTSQERQRFRNRTRECLGDVDPQCPANCSPGLAHDLDTESENRSWLENCCPVDGG
jgi:hypothetical protein